MKRRKDQHDEGRVFSAELLLSMFRRRTYTEDAHVAWMAVNRYCRDVLRPFYGDIVFTKRESDRFIGRNKADAHFVEQIENAFYRQEYAPVAQLPMDVSNAFPPLDVDLSSAGNSTVMDPDYEYQDELDSLGSGFNDAELLRDGDVVDDVHVEPPTPIDFAVFLGDGRQGNHRVGRKVGHERMSKMLVRNICKTDGDGNGNGVGVYQVREYNTSKVCPLCGELSLQPAKYHRTVRPWAKKNRYVCYGLLRCRKCVVPVGNEDDLRHNHLQWNRDNMAVLNQFTIVESCLRLGVTPPKFIPPAPPVYNAGA